MKATDLMIGDWVSCDGKCYQIAELGGMVCLDAEKEIFASLEDITPIHITPEILEKNGFVYDSHCNGWECSIDKQLAGDGFELQIITIYGLRMITITTAIADMTLHLKSVHELQHALKLCGIEKEITL